MIGTLLIFQFILTVILTLVVLFQKSSSAGLGAYSGSNDSFFGAKGNAGFLTKLTFVIGILFVANTITLGYLYNSSLNKSILDKKIEVKIPASEGNKSSANIPEAPSNS